MPFEPPSKGNLNQLTVDQHVHTAHAISKFYDADEKVEVFDLAVGQLVRRHKRGKIFCTKRTWDQRAESGFMAPIEKAFHEEIDNIKRYASRNHEAISRYCLLWRLRHRYHLSDNQDVILESISSFGVTKEQGEVVEKKHGLFSRAEGVIPSRATVGFRIQTDLDRLWFYCKDFKWGLITSNDGEFVVADGYGDCPFIPVTPKLAFCAGEPDQTITSQQLAEINKDSIARAKEFFFCEKAQ